MNSKTTAIERTRRKQEARHELAPRHAAIHGVVMMNFIMHITMDAIMNVTMKIL